MLKTKSNIHVTKIKPYVPGKPIEEVKREFGIKDVIKLASNENPFPPSPVVKKAIVASIEDLSRYPDGSCFELRQELSKRLKVDPQQLVFGCGSDEVIVLALRAFINEGDEVIVAKPSFLVYSLASTLAGARVVEVPLNGLRYDMVRMKQEVNERTKIIFIGNPDNPSGQYPTKKELMEFMKDLPDEVIVFFDEAYYEFAKDEEDYADVLKFLYSKRNVIVARTFSKLYGLAGLRIGYGVALPEVADLMNRAREPFNVTTTAQVAAVAALKDETYYQNILKEIKQERENLCKALSHFADQGVSVSKGSTNFIQICTRQDSRALTLSLIKKGIIVRDMSVWGLTNYIRVTIGTKKENEKFLQAFKESL